MQIHKLNREQQIFLVFLPLLALFTTRGASPNEASRYATIQSLVDNHSFIIDNSSFIGTIDKYFYQGHFYSDKPPILSIYSSFFYAIFKAVGISFNNHFSLACYFMTLLVVGVMTCFGLVYFYRVMKLLQVDDRWANVVLVITGTATLLLPYSTVFNNHTVSGSLLIIGFYYLLRITESRTYAVLAGLAIALAGSIDINCFLFLIFFSFSLVDKPWRIKLAFASTAASVLVVYFILNFYTSGSLVPPAMNQSLWNYPGSAFDQNSLSGLANHADFQDQLIYAFHMLMGRRGLLSYTPILVFSIFAFAAILRDQTCEHRKEYLLIALGSVSYIALYILRSNNYSGAAYGVRWYADLMFLLCLPLAHIGESVRRSNLFRKAFLTITLLSVAISFIGLINPFVKDDYGIDSFVTVFMVMFERISTADSPLHAIVRLGKYCLIPVMAVLASGLILKLTDLAVLKSASAQQQPDPRSLEANSNI